MCRMLASAVPPIRGNNPLMLTVWGGADKREGQFWGDGMTEKGQDGGNWVKIKQSLTVSQHKFYVSDFRNATQNKCSGIF